MPSGLRGEFNDGNSPASYCLQIVMLPVELWRIQMVPRNQKSVQNGNEKSGERERERFQGISDEL